MELRPSFCASARLSSTPCPPELAFYKIILENYVPAHALASPVALLAQKISPTHAPNEILNTIPPRQRTKKRGRANYRSNSSLIWLLLCGCLPSQPKPRLCHMQREGRGVVRPILYLSSTLHYLPTYLPIYLLPSPFEPFVHDLYLFIRRLHL